MQHARLWLGCVALIALGNAHGQGPGTVWKCVEPDGRAHYTNIKKETDGRTCTIVTKEVSVVPAPAVSRPAPAPTSSPPNFPRVDRDTQRARDDSRRKILEDELAAEEKSLVDAKAKLAEQEAARGGDEKNYQRVLDRLKPFQEAIERHERNIGALRRELSSIR